MWDSGCEGYGLDNAFRSLPLRADVLLSNTLFEELDEGCLSEEVLRHLSGSQDLAKVHFLELQVDTTLGAQHLESLGELLPALSQLRLSHSHIPILRDLGTSLGKLRVLWMARCGLTDLGGAGAMPVLEELYVPFNDIKDLGPLCVCDALQVLDVEGNLVTDFLEVQSLEAIPSLRELNLSLNPVWQAEQLTRAEVLRALPQLEVLDDCPRSASACDDCIEKVCDGLNYEGKSDSQSACFESMSRQHSVCDGVARSDCISSGDAALLALRRRALSFSPSPINEATAHDGEAARGSDFVLSSSKCGLNPPAFAPIAVAIETMAASADTSPEVLDCVENCVESRSPAVAALHAWRQRQRSILKQQHFSSLGSLTDVQDCLADCFANGDEAVGEASGKGFQAEPGEEELLLEGLKRAPRPVPSAWSIRASTPCLCPDTLIACPSAFPGSSPGFRRPLTGFSSVDRGIGTWACVLYKRGPSSIGSQSTMYRPSTGSSLCTSRTESESGCASDLTSGGDGESLAGSAMSAVRRRRKIAGTQAVEEGLDIRCLLRRHEDVYEVPTVEDQKGPLRHTGLPDVRVSSAVSISSSCSFRPLTSLSARRPSTGVPSFEKGSRSSKSLRASTSDSHVKVQKRDEERVWRGRDSPTYRIATGELLLLE